MGLLEILFSFQQWKNFENPLRIDKAIAMSLVYYILEHCIILDHCHLMKCLLPTVNATAAITPTNVLIMITGDKPPEETPGDYPYREKSHRR